MDQPTKRGASPLLSEDRDETSANQTYSGKVWLLEAIKYVSSYLAHAWLPVTEISGPKNWNPSVHLPWERGEEEHPASGELSCIHACIKIIQNGRSNTHINTYGH